MTAAKSQVVKFGYSKIWFTIIAIAIEAAVAYLAISAVLSADSSLRTFWLVFCAIVGTIAFLFFVPPIFTSYYVGKKSLRVRMGFLIDETIPYSVIREVKETSIDRGGLRVGVGVRYFPLSKIVYVTSSFSELVVLKLRSQRTMGTLWKRPVEEMVLSVKDKARFIEILRERMGLVKGA